ncbi:THAP domain-containing protein 11 isoform X1 [Leptidea sinapis]|uniref:THAP domain-containing protein 11 isoform X1 n=1 Tax=Leptidea sinapis TaxID=189913 RepID=UPI00212B8D97|nr:THAP domain-containing protein 11 isoform X1 [Leptidea sinapis]
MVRCSVLGCKSDSEKKHPDLSFHTFPRDHDLQIRWIEATGRNNWTPKLSSRICSTHFEKNVLIKKNKLTVLFPNSIPLLVKIKKEVPTEISSNEEHGTSQYSYIFERDVTTIPSRKRPFSCSTDDASRRKVNLLGKTEESDVNTHNEESNVESTPEALEVRNVYDAEFVIVSGDEPQIKQEPVETESDMRPAVSVTGAASDIETDVAATVRETAELRIKQEPVDTEAEGDSAPVLYDTESWQQREQELLKKIDALETVKSERSEDGLRLQLKVREEEIELLKARVKNLETELQAALSKPGGKNQEMIDSIKVQHEELLSKARGMIFDKTKMVKNQELQIQALTTQVQSLKDINVITKDLLTIRNSEVKAMEDRLQAMEARFAAEKERHGLVLKRAETSSSLNDDLRKEYEKQLAIFKELREKYDLRVKALVAENERLKESINTPAPTS